MNKYKGKELSSLTDTCIDSIEKLDLSDNLLKDFDGIDSCQETLTWLNASHNQIHSLKHLKDCTKLNVLNLSFNNISSTKHLKKLKGLKALILNNNELKSLDGINSLKELNTVVISRNNLDTIDISGLIKLEKLSASHNSFEEFPNLQALKDIKDLKLNSNNIREIPSWIITKKSYPRSGFGSKVVFLRPPKVVWSAVFAVQMKLKRTNNRKTLVQSDFTEVEVFRIKVLDLGNNQLQTINSIAILKELPFLENLNLRGNPLCDDEEYHIKIKELLPNLKILDFKKMSELYFKAIETKAKKTDTEKNIVKKSFKDDKKENSAKIEKPLRGFKPMANNNDGSYPLKIDVSNEDQIVNASGDMTTKRAKKRRFKENSVEELDKPVLEEPKRKEPKKNKKIKKEDKKEKTKRTGLISVEKVKKKKSSGTEKLFSPLLVGNGELPKW